MKQKSEHRKKLRMARRMMTKQEIKKHISPFTSEAWSKRKENKAIRLKNLIVKRSWNKNK